MKHLRILSLFFILIISGCSQINKASDFITNPTAKEQYQRDLEISPELFEIWKNAAEIAFKDSTIITPPYTESGKYFPKSFPVYGYGIKLNTGEILELQLETDSVETLVFIDLFKKTEDSLPKFKRIASSKFQEKKLGFEIAKSGFFKVIIQPEIEAHIKFSLKIEKKPAYLFPVSNGENTNIQSYWGANRDGGARSHEGIDVFASRGTPVLAATNGRIRFTGEKGLGGKQVWLRDGQRKQSIYYAHLDSIANVSGKVKRGDTLGFVGNTGNAKTTAPHLHFGIYKGYGGAINPLYFVYKTDKIEDQSISEITASHLIVRSSTANLRNRPTTSNSAILNSAKAGDTLQLLGKSENWFHVRASNNRASFVHESLVSP